MNSQNQRILMVKEQLIARGISDERVLAAFYKVERHKFIPEEYISNSYGDFPLPIGQGQTISQPFIVATMTENLDLTGNEKVLEIGTGSGYQTAILAELSKEVYTVEKFTSLSESAHKILSELGYKNIKFKVDDGSLGWPEEAAFDRIIVTAAAPRIPLPFIGQLKDGGKIVAPLGSGFDQMLTLAENINGHFKYKEICSCIFVPLIGKFGFKE